MWSGLIWLRTGTSRGLMRTWQRLCKFCKMQGPSSQPENFLGAQGPWSMGLDSIVHN